ncbi:MAG: class I SAM-dependent methyltransferase [Desulfobacterales bacterium]|nr:class I SAM-dependent methyltransferase [Desulfobacterales bacterium]
MPPQRQARIEKHAQMLANRVRKRFKHLHKRFARRNIEVFRLYDWDIPEIRAVVDWYDGHLVIGEYTRQQTVPEWLPAMGRAVAEVLGVPGDKVHLKARRAGRQGGRRYERIDHTDRKIIVNERDLRFFVNPYDFVDTGLFSDHRNTRQMVREMAAGRDFLNLYCYTAAFTCYAAKGGARTTLSVDRADTAVRWARQNLELNAIPLGSHTLVQMHALDFLTKARAGGYTYDLAVVDPPSYSTTRVDGEQFDIARDHPWLLEAVIAVMRPGATVFFSTNHQDFQPRLTGLPLKALEEITEKTIPEDYIRRRAPIHRCWRLTV